MKIRHIAVLTALALMLAACAIAAGVGRVDYVTADLAKRTATVAWTWTDLSDNAVRLSLTRNGEDFPTAGWGGTLFVGDGALGCAVAGVAHGYNELLFDVGRGNVPTNGKYVVQVIATNTAGRVEEWARGTLTVRANPSADGMPTNWTAYADIARRVAPFIDAHGILTDPANVDALWGAVSNRTDALIHDVSPMPDFSTNNATLVATIESKATAPVTSVNGHTGAVVLAASDVGAISSKTNAALQVAPNGTLSLDIPKGDDLKVRLWPYQSNVEFYTTEDGISYFPSLRFGKSFFVNAQNGASIESSLGRAEIYGADGVRVRTSSAGELRLDGNGLTYNYSRILTEGDADAKYATKNAVEEVSDKAAENATSISAWTTYWAGDDVRVTITNYFGNLDWPRLLVEQKVTDDGTNFFKTVWDEGTRFGVLTNMIDATSNYVDSAARESRRWGRYDSETGVESPQGVTQVGGEVISICPNMSWTKIVDSQGFWILAANNPQFLTGDNETGYFRISDANGSPLFEVVQGNKRIIGAVATNCHFNAQTKRFVVSYPVTSETHPTLMGTNSLKDEFVAEDENGNIGEIGSVAWSGSSGNWTATVNPNNARSFFCQAFFEAGGETYIKNHVASSMDKIVVGGQSYGVRVETVNGKKLLVLE